MQKTAMMFNQSPQQTSSCMSNKLESSSYGYTLGSQNVEARVNYKYKQGQVIKDVITGGDITNQIGGVFGSNLPTLGSFDIHTKRKNPINIKLESLKVEDQPAEEKQKYQPYLNAIFSQRTTSTTQRVSGEESPRRYISRPRVANFHHSNKRKIVKLSDINA